MHEVRQTIQYAEEMWRRQRFWALILVVVGVVMTGYSFLYGKGMRLTDVNSGWVWLLYIPSGLLLAGALLVYRRRSYIAAGSRLRISNLLSSVDIDYDLVRAVRVQPLKAAFEEKSRKRYSTPITRPYEERPALFVRLRSEDPRTFAIVRKLGSRLAWEDTIAVPIADPDAMSWEIESKLPERLGQNLGGQRRRKRR